MLEGPELSAAAVNHYQLAARARLRPGAASGAPRALAVPVATCCPPGHLPARRARHGELEIKPRRGGEEPGVGRAVGSLQASAEPTWPALDGRVSLAGVATGLLRGGGGQALRGGSWAWPWLPVAQLRGRARGGRGGDPGQLLCAPGQGLIPGPSCPH